MVRPIVAALVSAALWQAVPPPLERFVEASSADERIARAALDRISAGWKDSYAAMIVDTVRFMRPQRRGAEVMAEPQLTLDDERGTSGPDRPFNDVSNFVKRDMPK